MEQQFGNLPEKNDQENTSETVVEAKNTEQFLKEHGMENPPNVKFDFYFTDHHSQEAGEGLLKKMKENDFDVFMPEAISSERSINEMTQLSEGEITAEEYLKLRQDRGIYASDFDKQMAEGLYNSRKKILFVDIPEDYKGSFKDEKTLLERYYSAINEQEDELNKLFAERKLTYEETIERVHHIMQEKSSMQKEREDYILNNTKEKILELLNENPDLAGKSDLQILSFWGSFHTRLYHEMKKSGESITRDFDEGTPYKYSLILSLERYTHLIGEEEVKKHLYKYTLIMSAVPLLMANILDRKTAQHIVSKFTEQQAMDLFDLHNSSETNEEYFTKAKQWIDQELSTGI